MPAKPPDKSVAIVLRPSDYELVENWRRAQPNIPSRAEIIRTFALDGIRAASEKTGLLPPARPERAA
jgi:hypothetical protein